ncbi:hypothetical protein BG004_004410 [Podila humilis]|nr:hypothetical protein BG004_004410 [Podila humilis]
MQLIAENSLVGHRIRHICGPADPILSNGLPRSSPGGHPDLYDVAFFAWHTDFSLPDYHVHSENNDVRPTGVYLYQPRIDQSLVNRRPDEEELEAPATIATPAPVPVNESRIRQQLRWFFDANESQERMDELPRYQRQTPVSSAVIIDMANLDNDIADADALPESETRNWELPEMPEQAATGSTREAAWTRTHDHSADSHHSRLSPSATTTTTTTTTMTLTGTVSGTLPTTEPPSYTP